MLRTDERTNRQTDGRSGPTTRPAFAKAVQVIIKTYPSCLHDITQEHIAPHNYHLVVPLQQC